MAQNQTPVISTMHPKDIALAIRGLNDTDLVELVAYLSSDYLEGQASSAATMTYIFTTSAAHRKARHPSTLRQQARGY